MQYLELPLGVLHVATIYSLWLPWTVCSHGDLQVMEPRLSRAYMATAM